MADVHLHFCEGCDEWSVIEHDHELDRIEDAIEHIARDEDSR